MYLQASSKGNFSFSRLKSRYCHFQGYHGLFEALHVAAPDFCSRGTGRCYPTGTWSSPSLSTHSRVLSDMECKKQGNRQKNVGNRLKKSHKTKNTVMPLWWWMMNDEWRMNRYRTQPCGHGSLCHAVFRSERADMLNEKAKIHCRPDVLTV